MTQTSPVRRVFFDLGHVLFYLRPMRMMEAVAAYTAGDAATITAQFLKSGLQIDYERGALDSDTFFEKTAHLIGFLGTRAQFDQAWNQMIDPNPHNLATARALGAHYPIGFISNTNDIHIRYAEQCGQLLDFSDIRIYSHEAQFLKPRNEIYEVALKAAELPASACVFIDDRMDNIEAAQALGFHAYHLEPDASIQTLWNETIAPKLSCPRI